ncbi:MAG: hypothetical protein P9M15_00660 [Candidatus Electryoneaceae bacterium]|nr:hypothetical protein [Candidatus Electryoneaceae bacterium]
MKLTLAFIIVTALLAASDQGLTENVGLDIYNRDQALIREIRSVDLVKGVNTVDFHRIASGIYAHTAYAQPLEQTDRVSLLSLSYQYQTFNPDELLEHYLGAWFSFICGTQRYEGRLLHFDDYDIYFQPDSTVPTIQALDRGDITQFDSMPSRMVTEPTLRWKVRSKKKLTNFPVELMYITSGIAWTCDYRAELISDDEMELSGYFSLDNGLQIDFPQARITLVAGQTHRSRDPQSVERDAHPGIGEGRDRVERLFEYYRYPLEESVDLTGNMTMQIPFFEPRRVGIEQRFVVPHILGGDVVRTKIRFCNDHTSGIGQPLPEGDFGLYRRAADRTLMFVGEDKISATPVGDIVEVDVGTAFDLTAKRTRLTQSRPDRSRHEETWRVELANNRRETTVIHVEQRVFGYYEVIGATVDGQSIDYVVEEANTIVFPVTILSGGASVLDFTLRYGY